MKTLPKQHLKKCNLGYYKFCAAIVMSVAQLMFASAAHASIFSNNDNTPTKVSLSQELNDRLIKNEIWRNQQLTRQPRPHAGYWYYWDPRVAYGGDGGVRYQERRPVRVPAHAYQYHAPQVPQQPKEAVNEEQKQLNNSSTYPIYLDW